MACFWMFVEACAHLEAAAMQCCVELSPSLLPERHAKLKNLNGHDNEHTVPPCGDV